MKLAWLSDTRLDLGSRIDIMRLCTMIRKENADAIVITGNVSSGNGLLESLDGLETHAMKPIYFVLGQRDFTQRSIDDVRAIATAAEAEEGFDPIVYLSTKSPVELTESTSLVGMDGWGDLRAGDKLDTQFWMRDHVAIKDFQNMDNDSMMQHLRSLADSDAYRVRQSLLSVLDSGKDVVLATGVAPFSELLEKDGGMPNGSIVSYYTCTVLGDLLIELADAWPERKIRVLCGGRQTGTTFSPRKNLVCEANSEMGPRLGTQKFVEIE